MNILYLIFHGLSPNSGISKKILNQIDGLKAQGHEVYLCHYEIQKNDHRVRLINNTILQDYGTGYWASFRKRISYEAILQYALQKKIQFIYVRSFHNANPFTIYLFHQLKKAGIKVVMEIPTYPYDQEYSLLPFQWKIELIVDKCFRKILAKNCNKIVTFSEHQEIFGQKTIQISNGVNFKNIPLKDKQEKITDDLNLIGVAEIHYWHGYDRIIEGLGLYYQSNPSRKVHFYLIGGIGGVEQTTFDTLIEKYNIGSYVHLCGQKQGEELNNFFNQCDFGVGSLGRHRSGIYKIKTLKNREYAARGIPFIYSEIDDDFEKMPYILKAPADDSPINIKAILDFYDKLPISALNIRESIQNLSWQKQMQKVINEVFPH